MDVLSRHPSIVIVLLGGNDMLRRLDLDESFKLLEADVQRLQRDGAMVVLVGIRDLPLMGDGMGGALPEGGPTHRRAARAQYS